MRVAGRRLGVARLGFVGLGEMGGRMALHAPKLGIKQLRLFDANPSAIDKLTQGLKGVDCDVVLCASATEAARDVDGVISMLPNGTIVREVYGSLLKEASKGTLFIDCSTVDPTTSREIAVQVADRGCSFADAPVSGGVVAAAAATLTFMVGSPDDVLPQVQALLAPFGKSVVHAGGVGCGSVCKVCNNMILGQHMLAVSEAMLLGARLGVDPRTLAQIVSISSGSCWSNNAYNPFPGVCPEVPASKGYIGGFESRLMLKDLNLALQAASSVGLVVDGATTAQKAYTALVADAAYARKDFASILSFIDKKSPAPK